MTDSTAPQHSSLLDGARQLLIDSMAVLNEAGCDEYIVIGGWCPYLRNSTKIAHPGTLDVDVLFKFGYQSGDLEKVVRTFIERGFLPSAKHSFQLLRKQSVDGTDLIYNVDLLHPRMTIEDPSLFVDHLDLDIRLAPTGPATKKMVSIAQPNSIALFDHSLYSPHNDRGTVFNLVSFTGMLLTKIDSCQRPKRERDSFDIYLAALNNEIDIGCLQKICSENKRIRDSMVGFLSHLGKKAGEFDRCVQLFAGPLDDSPAEFLRRGLSRLRLD